MVGEAVTVTDLPRPFLWEDGVMKDLGAFETGGSGQAFAINDRGQVVGSSVVAGNDHAFIWDRGVMTDLTGLNSQALSINNRGQVVGVSTTSSGVGQAFLYENGKITVLGTLGGDFSSASSVNERGEVVGSSITANGALHPCLWRTNE